MNVVLGAGLVASVVIEELLAKGLPCIQVIVASRSLRPASEIERHILRLAESPRGYSGVWHGVLSFPAQCSGEVKLAAEGFIGRHYGAEVARWVLGGASFVPVRPLRPPKGLRERVRRLQVEKVLGIDSCNGGSVRVRLSCGRSQLTLEASRVVIACGALGTYEILLRAGLAGGGASFDDLSLGTFGVVRRDVLPPTPVKWLPRGHLKWYHRLELPPVRVLYTARPYYRASFEEDPFEEFAIYAASQARVCLNLVRAARPSRFAEAFYNKFGFALPSRFVRLVGHMLRAKVLTVEGGVVRYDGLVAEQRELPAGAWTVVIPRVTVPGFHFTNMQLDGWMAPIVGSLYSESDTQTRPVLLASGGMIQEQVMEHTTALIIAKSIVGARRLGECL